MSSKTLSCYIELEEASAQAGLPMVIFRDEEEWNNSEQGKILKASPIVPMEKIGFAPPKPLSPSPKRPLEGLKVLCVTHAIAGPSAGRTLAEHGASVLQIMFTHGFEHHFVYSYANLGCASARLNFHKKSDIDQLWNLIKEADVWIDSYREGAISKFGFTDKDMIQANPNLIISHCRCFGTSGPFASRPGFDMQGSAASELMAVCGNGARDPSWPPGMVINDYTTGYYSALAIQSALLRRSKEGGAYILSPSLTGTAMSILKYFKTQPGVSSSSSSPLPPREMESPTPCGYLRALEPLPKMTVTSVKYDPIVLVPIGSSPPVFPGDEETWSPNDTTPRSKEKFFHNVGIPAMKKFKQLAELGRKHQ